MTLLTRFLLVAALPVSTASAATRLVICALQARDLPNLDSDEHFGRDASDPYLGIFVGDGAE